MSQVLVTDSYLTGIANAIRGKNGSSDTYTPAQMAEAIADIPNSYDAGDEGKVVSNGALVAQTTHAEITENGTYDITTNNSVTVNVSGGGGGNVTCVEMTLCEQQCYLYKGGNRGWAVYPDSPGAVNFYTFYADIPASHQNGGMIILSTKQPSDVGYTLTRNRIGFTNGIENPTNLPNGETNGNTTQPQYYMNAANGVRTAQFTMVKVPNGMTRVYWTTNQSGELYGRKCYMWLITDRDFLDALNMNWQYYISNTITGSENPVSAWPTN